MLSAKLKRHIVMLVAAALLAGMALAMLASIAEAQEDIGRTSAENLQNNNQLSGATVVPAAPEPTLVQVVVNPGDTLWTIAQKQLGASASPQQVYEEVGRIYELNRDQIGENPNLILAGLKLSLTPLAQPQAAEPAVAPTSAQPAPEQPTVEQPAAAEPAAVTPTSAQPAPEQPTAEQPTVAPDSSEPTPEEPAAAEPAAVTPTSVQPAPEQPTAEELAATPMEPLPKPNNSEDHLLGLRVLVPGFVFVLLMACVLGFALVLLMEWKLFIREDVEGLRMWKYLLSVSHKEPPTETDSLRTSSSLTHASKAEVPRAASGLMKQPMKVAKVMQARINTLKAKFALKRNLLENSECVANQERRGLQLQPTEPELTSTEKERGAEMRCVLLVEPHHTLRQALASSLEQESNLQVIAQSGSLAELRSIALEKIDVAVVETLLPDGDGIELITEINTYRIPVVGITLSPSSDVGTKALKAGATKMLGKDISFEELVEVVSGIETHEESTDMSTSVDHRSYTELGDLLASLVQKRHVPDHEAIAKRIEEVVDYRVSPHLIAKYLCGSSLPEPEFFHAFAEAFSLTMEERRDLAWLCSYGCIPSEEAWLHFSKEI